MIGFRPPDFLGNSSAKLVFGSSVCLYVNIPMLLITSQLTECKIRISPPEVLVDLVVPKIERLAELL